MDRFSRLIIGICVCACVAVLLFVFISTSTILWNAATGDSDAVPPVVFVERPKPERAGPGRLAPGSPPPEQPREVRIRVNPFTVMSAEEKNTAWWEIANSARRSGALEMTFTLEIDTLSRLGHQFGCTREQLLAFFREGPDSDWLRPEEKESKKEPRR